MSKKNKMNTLDTSDEKALAIDMNDVTKALNSDENEFGDIQVEIMDDATDSSKLNATEECKDAPEKKENETQAKEVEKPVRKIMEPIPQIIRAPENHENAEESVNIEVGSKVKINRSTMYTLDRRKIPNFAYDRVFEVTRIIPDRIFIKNKAYTISVNRSDVKLV